MASTVQALELRDLPQMDAGAPAPLVIADEHRVALSYWLRGSEYWMLPESERRELKEIENCAFLLFTKAIFHRLGSPGDETLRGHPYSAAGVKAYAAYVIRSSPSIEELKRINSVQRFHKPARYENYTHFFFAFHDSTFECVAQSLQTATEIVQQGNDKRRLEQMSNLILSSQHSAPNA